MTLLTASKTDTPRIRGNAVVRKCDADSKSIATTFQLAGNPSPSVYLSPITAALLTASKTETPRPFKTRDHLWRSSSPTHLDRPSPAMSMASLSAALHNYFHSQHPMTRRTVSTKTWMKPKSGANNPECVDNCHLLHLFSFIASPSYPPSPTIQPTLTYTRSYLSATQIFIWNRLLSRFHCWTLIISIIHRQHSALEYPVRRQQKLAHCFTCISGPSNELYFFCLQPVSFSSYHGKY